MPPPPIEGAAFWLFALAEIVLVGIVIVLAVRTALLRDADPSIPDFTQRPFSLSKSQLAFWTVIIISTYLYIFIVNPAGVVNVLNTTALELLGISMATSAAAGVTGAPAAPAARTPVPFSPRPLQAQTPGQPLGQRHRNYIDDILSDNDGTNIHRLQMVLWTLVFGGVFAYLCYQTRKFPDFDQQVFILMGISSGTYVWFRRTES
jgi:hypothetical protein